MLLYNRDTTAAMSCMVVVSAVQTGKFSSDVFNRPYCGAAWWSAICDILSSVCPSVCNAVHCGSQGRCTWLKLHQRVPSRQTPICPFRHFCCWITRMYRLATRRTIKRVEENANLNFLRHRNARALVYSTLLTVENLRRSTLRTSFVTLEWIAFGCVRKS